MEISAEATTPTKRSRPKRTVEEAMAAAHRNGVKALGRLCGLITSECVHHPDLMPSMLTMEDVPKVRELGDALSSQNEDQARQIVVSELERSKAAGHSPNPFFVDAGTILRVEHFRKAQA